jgi:hypothetical protein
LSTPSRHIACYEDFEDGRPMTRYHVSLEPFSFGSKDSDFNCISFYLNCPRLRMAR